jgi:uncharacterized protein YkwD
MLDLADEELVRIKKELAEAQPPAQPQEPAAAVPPEAAAPAATTQPEAPANVAAGTQSQQQQQWPAEWPTPPSAAAAAAEEWPFLVDQSLPSLKTDKDMVGRYIGLLVERNVDINDPAQYAYMVATVEELLKLRRNAPSR